MLPAIVPDIRMKRKSPGRFPPYAQIWNFILTASWFSLPERMHSPPPQTRILATNTHWLAGYSVKSLTIHFKQKMALFLVDAFYVKKRDYFWIPNFFSILTTIAVPRRERPGVSNILRAHWVMSSRRSRLRWYFHSGNELCDLDDIIAFLALHGQQLRQSQIDVNDSRFDSSKLSCVLFSF